MTTVEDLKSARVVAITASGKAGPIRAGGVGYGSRRDAYSSMPNSPEDVKTFKAIGEIDSDANIAKTIDMISREIIPGPHDTTVFDRLTVMLLSHSLFLESVVSLIRNDSVDNFTERKMLYEKLFSLLQLLAGQNELCKILVSPRPNMKESPGLWQLYDTWSTSEFEKTLPPVLNSFENTYKQALTFIGLAEKHPAAASKLVSLF